jgi:hypothetical protein
MRFTSTLVGLIALVSATKAMAAEPVTLVSPGQPLLLMASATACDGNVTLRLRVVQFEPATQEVITQIPVKETAIVNGRVVEKMRIVQERKQTTVLKPVPGATIDATIDGLAVIVQDLKGKPIAPASITNLLKKETAVLVSISGPVDPYYLQTTKPGTLIVQIPAQLLNSPGEALPPIRTAPADPIEPPIAPPKPKLDPTEPPIAPPKPKLDPTEPPIAPAKKDGK